MRQVLLAGAIAGLGLCLGAAELPPLDSAIGTAEARAKKEKKRKKPRAARLLPFDTCDSLISFGDRHATRLYGADYGEENLSPPIAVSDDAVTKQKGEGAAATGGGDSTTNVQVQGVDEPDIVKSGGGIIYAVSGGALRVVDARGATPQLLESLPLEGFRHELLLAGSKLLVISNNYETPLAVDPNAPKDPPPSGPGSSPGAPYELTSPTTTLTEIDVSKPGSLRVLNTQKVDGLYLSARLTGEQVRLVLSATPAALDFKASRLRSPLAGWVPFSRTENRTTGVTETGPALGACPEVAHPGQFSGLNMLAVFTIDLARGLPAVDADAVMTDGEVVYASPQSLYVTTTRWGAAEPNSTAIHKFDTSNPGETTYRASGAVHGYLLNQFSLDEHEGFLRAATTGDATGGGTDPFETESFVTVLEERVGRLATVGRIGELGRGEEIYAVRMIGDTGYVVTFRNTDPLFTLDLSDPQNPRLLGELEIRGYSAYLHPLGPDRLIGIGQDATLDGFTLGTQLSLFDVSNLSNPVRLENRVVAGGNSEVEYDHHAFLYWEPSHLAVIPLSADGKKGRRFRGAAGFSIDGSRIAELGRIAHPPARRRPAIRRSLVVGGRLFTLSCRGMQMAGLASLNQLAWVPFPARRNCR